MAKNSKDAYGASGHSNLLTFDPAKLKIIDDPKHPLYDKRVNRPIDEGMVESIMQFGVKEPIIVWKDPETGDVCVVAGRQRTRNNIEANKRLVKRGDLPKDIKAVVERGDPKNLMLIAALENEGRSANTPEERADITRRMLEAGHSEDVIAVVLHCSKSTVKNYIALLETTGAVRKAVASGRVDPTVAYKLAKLHPSEQNAKLEAILKASGDNDDLEVETLSGGKSKGKKKPKKKARKVAKKIREIISGNKGMPSKREIQIMLKKVSEEVEDIKENARSVAVAMLKYVLEGTAPTFEETFWRR